MRSYFEVLAFRQTTKPNEPDLEHRATFLTYTPAMVLAKRLAKQYWRVEVADVMIEDDDWTIAEDELIASWENGVKTL